jgi:hypothetical protein
MNKIKMTREDWNLIGRRSGWLKTAEISVVTRYDRHGDPGEWIPYGEGKKIYDFQIKGEARQEILGAAIEIGKRSGLDWLYWAEGCQLKAEMEVAEEGMRRDIPGGTEHGYRSDFDYAERDVPSRVDTKDVTVLSTLKAQISCQSGGSMTVVWSIRKEKNNWGDGREMMRLTRMDSGIPNLARMIMTGEAAVVYRNDPERQKVAPKDQEAPKKKPGLFGRLFGKSSSFDWETGKVI